MKKILLVLFFILYFAPIATAQVQPTTEVKVEARVVKILESSRIIEESGNSHPYQKLQLEGTSKNIKGKFITTENGKFDQTGIVVYKIGDQLVLTQMKGPQGISYSITDYVRRTPLAILFLIFVVLAVFIGGKRGASSLIGMTLTFALLYFFILPQISNGAHTLLMSTIAAIIIVPSTFFLSHGINKKTLCAILGTFIALILTGALASFFVQQAHLSGFASEEAGYLDVMKKGSIDIKGLLFAGIIIGLLGVLQDITVSQAAVVYQLKKANAKMKFIDLFTHAMDVGRDHIASMTNTLILVYAGASLPLLLLFINNPLPFSQVVNSEMISQEIVTTLISSIGLIIAVPITTLLTAFIAGVKTERSHIEKHQ
jgi:uncharacterized membrane protein